MSVGSSVVCLRNVCLLSLPSARSHKNYRHEFQSAFSNNKLGCLFLYGSSFFSYVHSLFFFFLCLVHFFSFFLALTYSPCLCLAETQIVNGCECVSKNKFYFSFARVPLFDPVGEVAFLQLIVFLSLGIFFLRLNM